MVIAMEPDTSSDQRPVIPASEILGKIERGEDVKYDGVIVEGDLDISGLELPMEHVERTTFDKQLELSDNLKLINQQITITNSEIRGIVNFSNTLFNKQIKFEGAMFSWEVNFLGAKFGEYAYFGRAEFGGHAYFNGVKFSGYANFGGTKFTELAIFRGVKFDRDAYFIEAKFGQGADFGRDEFGGHTLFIGAEFGRHGDFSETKFGVHTNFEKVGFREDADFRNAKFGWYAGFEEAEFGGYANFERAEFGRSVDFDYDQFRQNLSFKYTKFARPRYQELVCRIAKRKMEDLGNKNDADYYFYREMEAKRIQNGMKGIEQKAHQPSNNIRERMSQFRDRMVQIPSKTKRFLIYDVLEYIFIQRIFGYGVRPFNVAKAWLSVVFFLGVVYWAGVGVVRGNEPLEWYEYFYFSIVTAATPGYAGYTPATGFYTLIAGAQAIFGTFMWAAFIATFARKWQR